MSPNIEDGTKIAIFILPWKMFQNLLSQDPSVQMKNVVDGSCLTAN